MSGPLGAVLAGGQSSRYGAPKAFEPVGGEPLIRRVLRSLALAGLEPLVIVANEPAAYAPLGPDVRPDARPGNGVLGGIETALLWARELGRPGAIAVACDMPFVPPALVRRIAERAAGTDAPDIVAPESRGPRGVEPLCAYYGVACLPAIASQLQGETRHIIGFWAAVKVERVPLAEVARHGDPARLFLNVNTREERAAADSLAPDQPAPDERAPGAPA